MEESPPPVSPKDQFATDGSSRPPTAASGSKRKRQKQDYDFRSGRLDAADLEGQTPKRSRSHVGASDHENSTDETPLQNRSVRRKKGTRNLSAMNLRHAASAQAIMQRHDSPTRESRFHEGSLTDKPSEQPPSIFIRLPQSNSGDLSYREELMEDYQDGMPTPRDSIEAALQYEKDTRDERVAEITARQRKDEHGGIFRFGKSLASNFHPVTLWNRLWNEQKDELTRQNLIEAERKAKAKAEAEAKYAEMKSAGQLGLQPVSFGTPRDSGISFDDPSAAQLYPLEDQVWASAREGSEVPESASRLPLLRSVRSRLHMRKPSLQSLQQSVKRVRSHANIGTQRDRESSSSLSPTKATEFPEHTLLKSASKYDMKRQQKLSKRVSDLEAKLNKARSDLDEALVQASPAPQLGSKYQRFTPSGTLRKPKFVPGALPTLHSEGVLSAQQPLSHHNENSLTLEARPRIVVDVKTAFDVDENEETVKAPREKPYPARAKEVFQQSDGNNQQPQSTDQYEHNSEPAKTAPNDLDPAQDARKHAKIPNNIDLDGDNVPTESQYSAYADIDTNIKAAESNVKNNKKSIKSKKRLSRAEDERNFKPSGDDDDDAEWDEAIQQSKKKKRGMPENSPPSKVTGNNKPKAGQRKIVKQIATEEVMTRNSKIPAKLLASAEKISLSVTDVNGSEDELAKVISRRTSVASEDITLEPVYEEEEETSTVPLKDAPSKPTAKATPARFGYNAVRSRSSSPQKQVELGAEERIMTRAGNAARNKRSSSPEGRSQAATNGDAHYLTTGPTGTIKRVKVHESKTKEKFEWPDDVF